MTLRNKLLATVFAIGITAGLAVAAAQANQPAYDAPVELDITFVFHIDDNLPEQDVFVERGRGSNEVFRPTRGDRDLNRSMRRRHRWNTSRSTRTPSAPGRRAGRSA